jgi:uncharacterized protein YndB with AHSA1/START domain
MATTTPPTLNVTLPNDFEIRMTRTFDAPRALVYAAHTEPALLRRWMVGPPGWTMSACEVDLRVGGVFRCGWRNEADGTEFDVTGEYREIDPPARIVHVERYGDNGGESICTLTFDEDAAGRTTFAQTMRFPTREDRDAQIRGGAADGMDPGYDRLAVVLDELKAADRVA